MLWAGPHGLGHRIADYILSKGDKICARSRILARCHGIRDSFRKLNCSQPASPQKNCAATPAASQERNSRKFLDNHAMVESRRARWLGPCGHHSVSSPRSSNRTCGFPASGFPTGFTSKHTAVGQDGPDFVGSHRTPRTRPYRGNAWCLATTPCGRFRLRLDVELPPKAPELLGCCQDHRHSPLLAIIKSVPEVRALCSAGITRPHSSYGPVRRPRGPSPKVTSRARPSSPPGLPRLPVSLFQRAVPTTPADQDGCTCRLLPRPARPSPYHRRVGVRDFTFEACSGFTRITARWIAQPPKAAFVTGLRSIRLPGQTACQLPDQTDNCLGGSFLH